MVAFWQQQRHQLKPLIKQLESHKSCALTTHIHLRITLQHVKVHTFLGLRVVFVLVSLLLKGVLVEPGCTVEKAKAPISTFGAGALPLGPFMAQLWHTHPVL